MSSSSTPKQRSYQHLSSRLSTLSANLEQTIHQFDALQSNLLMMRKFGGEAGAQFMAVSRIVDAELEGTLPKIQTDVQVAAAMKAAAAVSI